MRLFRPFLLAGILYPEALFRIKGTGKTLYLTFDDGPDPVSTLTILKILEKHGIKAVFFCTGSKASEHPDLINAIKASGHVTGNHGYHHISGFSTSAREYVRNAVNAAELTSAELFRPPFGLLKISQYLLLRRKFKIVFWDLMPYDFDMSFGPENCLRVLKKKIRPGSIIVLHDTSQSSSLNILEDFIGFALGGGYKFGII
jgi:peptidoglycan/xylan/chitin deacetylase (PgdA/CDA1 family)